MTSPDSHAPEVSTADASMRAAVLVRPSELAALLGRADPPTVLVVRGPEATDPVAFATAARIPDALDTFLATDFAAPGDARRGSRPLPDIAALQASARRWGLGDATEVVVYDHEGGLNAARAWWVLRWAGVLSVRLLDGGFAAWESGGWPIGHRCASPAAGDVVLQGGQMRELDAAAAARLAREGLLLDSRMRENYEGGPGAPAGGHIPGAISVPAASNLDASGAFLDADGLHALYAAAGVAPDRRVGVYCGAGVSAAHDVLALATLGVDAPMYVGSWSAWSADPARPVVRGPAPG